MKSGSSIVPYSDQEPSYTAVLSEPQRRSATSTIQAVTPEPQLLMAGSFGSTFAFLKISASSSVGFNTPVSASTRSGNGTLIEPVMCPLLTPFFVGSVELKREAPRASVI